jgi:hypothetical protein
VAAASYGLLVRKAGAPALRNLGIVAGCLAAIAVCGAGYAWLAAGPVVANPAAFAFPRADLFLFSAKWWSYFVPPAASPLLGARAERLWASIGVREGLLEQQVSLGWGVVGLGLVGLWFYASARGKRLQPAGVRYVPVLAAVAVVALLCSLSPERTIGLFRFVRPSALLYDVLPIFRSYARFGQVVQLMAVLLAAIGVECLRRTGRPGARIACGVLMGLAAAEYVVSPRAAWRDVLPTPAHRWIMQQPGAVLALDCTPPDQESASIQWLTAGRIVLLGGATPDCLEPGLAEKLAATGYTHVIVRTGTRADRWLTDRVAPEGVRSLARFENAQVLAVTAPVPALYTATMTGWWPREHDAERSWQWMGAEGEWKIVNTTGGTAMAVLDVEIAAFHHPRRLEVRLDGQLRQTVVVEPLRRVYRLGPLAVPPGEHSLRFRPSAPATVVSDVQPGTDTRPLSFAFGTWRWTASSAGS